MWWKAFQIAVFMGVGCLGIYYEWSENKFATGMLAFLASMFATHFLSMAIDSVKSYRARKQ